MLWLAIGTMVIVAVVAGVVIFRKQPVSDLGSLSDQWLAHNRAESR